MWLVEIRVHPYPTILSPRKVNINKLLECWTHPFTVVKSYSTVTKYNREVTANQNHWSQLSVALVLIIENTATRNKRFDRNRD